MRETCWLYQQKQMCQLAPTLETDLKAFLPALDHTGNYKSTSKFRISSIIRIYSFILFFNTWQKRSISKSNYVNVATRLALLKLQYKKNVILGLANRPFTLVTKNQSIHFHQKERIAFKRFQTKQAIELVASTCEQYINFHQKERITYKRKQTKMAIVLVPSFFQTNCQKDTNTCQWS